MSPRPVAQQLRPLAEPDLWLERDRSIDNINAAGRDQLRRYGVSIEAECRCGFIGLERIATAGRLYWPAPDGWPAWIVGAWVGEAPGPYARTGPFLLGDLIAFDPARPHLWFYRNAAPGAALGFHHLQLAHLTGRPITLHPHPLAWLQAEGRGACDLERAEAFAGVQDAAEAA